MRKLRIMQHISLDGVIEIEAGSPIGDWTARYRTPAGRDLVTLIWGSSLDLLLGRRTYDLWSTHWPHAPASPMANTLNQATKYVLTHRPADLPWGPAQPIGSNLLESVPALKATPGPDLVLAGSSTLTSTLLRHGLVDELTLTVYPVLLGHGKRLLDDNATLCGFSIAATHTLPSGLAIRSYTPIAP